MAAKALFIHIGIPKTGTTTLQHFLHTNAKALESRGIWYPADMASSYCERHAHFPLAGSLVEKWQDFVSPAKEGQLATALSDFCADASSRHDGVTVISCEQFSSRVRSPVRLRQFRERLLSCFGTINVVCYIRRQPELALSSYHTAVVHGRRQPLDLSSITVDDPRFNYLALLDMWAGVFGEKSLIVREYGRKTLASGDICDDFIGNVLRTDDAQLTRVRDRNASRGAVFLELIRQLNLVLPSLEENASEWRTAQRIRSAIAANLRIDDDIPLRLNPEEERLLVERFADSNRQLNKRYLGGSMSHAWFHASSPDTVSDRTDDKTVADLTLNAMARLVAGLMGSMNGR